MSDTKKDRLSALMNRPDHWPGTAGWAESMGIALAVHYVLVNIARWPHNVSTSFLATTTAITIGSSLLAAAAIMLAVRRGHRIAYWIGLGLLFLPVRAFVNSIIYFEQIGRLGITISILPALMALAAIGCLLQPSTRAWILLRRGEIANAAPRNIELTHLGLFKTDGSEARLMDMEADSEAIRVVETRLGETEATVTQISIPRSDQIKLTLALRDVLKAGTLPSKDFDEALIEAVKAATNNRGLTLADIQALGIRDGFGFKLRQEKRVKSEAMAVELEAQRPTMH